MLNVEEIIDKSIQISSHKSKYNKKKLILQGIWAGFFVSLGMTVRNVAVFSIENESIGRVIGGIFLPIAFIFIVFLGGELFTGNSLMIMGVLDGKVKTRNMVRNALLIYIGNFLGAVGGAILVQYSGLLNISQGALGAYLIKVGVNKVQMDIGRVVVSGIICNVFVCSAILIGLVTKKVVDKFVLSWYVICCFAIIGVEHIVVNMYSLPAAIMASTKGTYVEKCMKIYKVPLEEINNINLLGLLENFASVTVGNLIGGIIIVGIGLYCTYKL